MRKISSRKGKIKILVVTSSFPREKTDWWGQFILKIYEHLPAKKYSITVLAPHAPGAKLQENIGDIKVFRFPYFYPLSFQLLTTGSGVLHSRKKILAKIQIFTFLMSEFLFFFYLVSRERFDVMHAHWLLPQGFFGVLLNKIFRIPLVVTIHGSDIFALQKLNAIKYFTLRNSTVSTANSTVTQSAACTVCPKVTPLLIPEGVDLKLFNPKKRNFQWREKMNNNNQLILAVGRLIEWKGFKYLIKAMPKIRMVFPKAKLIIVGSGPEEGNLIQMVHRLKLDGKVIFLGNASHDKLSIMFASSDIFVSPSITNNKSGEKEALGIVIIEAIASGIPVVASNSGGIRDIVDGYSTGYLAREKDVDDIAGKVITLLSHSEVAKKMTENGLVYVKKRYSWDIIAKKYAKAYADCISNKLATSAHP